MSAWYVLFGSLAVVAGTAALYGLHRLGLWLEEHGYIYYLHKKPSGSAAGCFVAIQRAVEPQAQNFVLVREEAYVKVGGTAESGPLPGSEMGDPQPLDGRNPE